MGLESQVQIFTFPLTAVWLWGNDLPQASDEIEVGMPQA
jgi:hypothetical protein